MPFRFTRTTLCLRFSACARLHWEARCTYLARFSTQTIYLNALRRAHLTTWCVSADQGASHQMYAYTDQLPLLCHRGCILALRCHLPRVPLLAHRGNYGRPGRPPRYVHAASLGREALDGPVPKGMRVTDIAGQQLHTACDRVSDSAGPSRTQFHQERRGSRPSAEGAGCLRRQSAALHRGQGDRAQRGLG